MPFLKALGLLSNLNFLIFLIVAFLPASQLQFFFLATAPYLSELGVPGRSIPAWHSLTRNRQAGAAWRRNHEAVSADATMRQRHALFAGSGGGLFGFLARGFQQPPVLNCIQVHRSQRMSAAASQRAQASISSR